MVDCFKVIASYQAFYQPYNFYNTDQGTTVPIGLLLSLLSNGHAMKLPLTESHTSNFLINGPFIGFSVKWL